MTESPDAAVTLVRTDVLQRVAELKSRAGKAIGICGGSELATALFAAGLVDRLVLKSAPIVFGAGIPLFCGKLEAVPLRPDAQRSFASGYSINEYAVVGSL